MKKYSFLLITITGLIIILFISSISLAQSNITSSIVKIYTVYNKHSYFRPWQMKGQESLSGSGCIIDGNRILTNAHVVADAMFIQVKRAGMAKKYTAEVEIVAHECDLAILRVKDKSFFEGAVPIEIGELPDVGDTVATYGFPEGGDELAFTEGVVSRVEHLSYTHSEANLLCCQIDAAINPGSSGGPVIKDDQIVGIAFQGGYGENIGYMVSVPVINHFLEDVKDGKYDGIPSLGASWQKIENPDMRLYYKMKEEHTGILLNKVYPGSPAKGLLRPGDIVLSVEGIDVANDGTIQFRENERTFFGYLIQNKFMGETAEFEILREGKVVKEKIELTIPTNFCKLVPNEQYDEVPRYYIAGGMVYQPLSVNYLNVRLEEDEYESDFFFNLFTYLETGEPTEERREIVVLASVLADEINVGYHDLRDVVISHVNGNKVSTLEDLIAAVEGNTGAYHVFVDERGKEIVLDKKKMDARNELILKRYQIPFDRSEDLRK
jgi:S1-C subfamily serine protease